MKKIAMAAAIALLVGGCATSIAQKPVPIAHAKKHIDPCPCSPTANEVVKKRWFSGYKVKLFH